MQDKSTDEIKEYLKTILQEIDNLRYGDEDKKPTLGEKAADKVVSFIGSWSFIIIQSVLLTLWIGANATWLSNINRFDPYPFILLNLALSFQAAFASPLILMASNRTEQKDRRRAADAYRSIEHIEQMMGLLVDKLKIVKENGNSHE